MPTAPSYADTGTIERCGDGVALVGDDGTRRRIVSRHLGGFVGFRVRVTGTLTAAGELAYVFVAKID